MHEQPEVAAESLDHHKHAGVQCTCSEENPICATPNSSCTISNDGVLALCLPSCDPLDPGTCSGGDVCIVGVCFTP